MKETKISFKSHGQKVAGILYEPDKKCDYTVINIPGFRSLKEWSRDRCLFLCKNGMRILAIELRGRGESEGVFEKMKLTDGIDDVIAAIDFVNTPIGLFGSSYGSMVALHTAARDKRVNAVALRIPLLDIKLSHEGKVIKEVKKHGFYDYVTPDGIHDIFTKKLINNMLKYNSFKTVKKINAPLLIVAAERDRIAPIEGTRKVYKNANHPKKLIELKNEGHDTSEKANKIINREVLKWFKKWLG